MSATRTTVIKITADEINAMIYGHVRDAYGLVCEPKHITFADDGTAIVTMTEDVPQKMTREFRPPSR